MGQKSLELINEMIEDEKREYIKQCIIICKKVGLERGLNLIPKSSIITREEFIKLFYLELGEDVVNEQKLQRKQFWKKG